MDWSAYIDRLRIVDKRSDLLEIMSLATRAMGFNYFSLIQRSDSSNELTGVQLSDFAPEWQEKLGERYYFVHDPVLEQAANRSLPFWWNEPQFVRSQSKRQRDFMADAATMGLTNGLSVPLFIPGEPAGLASFAVTDGAASPYAMAPVAQYIAAFGFEAGRRIERANEPVFAEADDLARYVITMLGRGRSAAVIAALANVPRQEVDSIINKAKRHYHVQSTTQIVVHALRAGKVSFLELIEKPAESPVQDACPDTVSNRFSKPRPITRR